MLLRGLKGKEGSSSRGLSEDDIRANWNTAQDWVWRRRGKIFVAAAKIFTVTTVDIAQFDIDGRCKNNILD